MRYNWDMELDPRTCYRALRTRDTRFDGRFFTGVTSTGVYCRPVCPARAPHRAHCRFFACAAAAQAAGFRPCLRCRPETAPGTPPWVGTSTTVARALRLIADDGLGAGGVPDLAERLGVGERHLRRLFLQHLGATPIAVVQTQRVLFAKKLLEETSLPMTTVAQEAGFASVRRFNAAMHATYGRPPSTLRRVRREDSAAAGVALELAYRPPLDWSAFLEFLGARAIPGLETIQGNAYVRSIRLGEAAGRLTIEPVPGASRLRVRVHTPVPVEMLRIVARVRALFDLAADPLAIASHFAGDPVLGPLVRARPGLRVPGAWDGFELAVRAVLGQQVSVRAARTFATRLVDRFGDRLPAENGFAGAPTHLFPTAARLADAELESIGIVRARARTLRTLAAAVASGDIALDGTQDPEATRAALLEISGIGAWTADIVALRALREPDAFPSGDLGLRRAFATVAKRGRSPRLVTETAIRRAADAWRPWRSYAVIHLWTEEARRDALSR